MRKDENGELVIEASIVISLALAVITALIYLGFTVLQQTSMQVIANETATNVAQIYAAEYKDPVYGYISESEFYKTKLYRNLTNAFTKSLDKVNQKKGEWYSIYRIKKTQLMNYEEPEIDVAIESKPGKIMQKQVVVTITYEISNPFALFWGSNLKAEQTVQGRSDCMDLIDYINFIDTASDAYKKVDKGLEPLGDLISNVEKWIGFAVKKVGGE